MSATTEPEAITFRSGDVELAGHLYRPHAPSGTSPGVVLCHGFSGTMDRLIPHAERFAASGLTVLVFDYRTFGQSGGEPRQLVDIAGQQEDIRSAVHVLRSSDGVDPDRVALWGNSLGGAHVITVAAGDPRVAAVVSQIPYNGFPKQVEGRRSGDTRKLAVAILWDALRGKLGLKPYYVKMVGGPGELAVVATDEAQRHIETLAGGGVASRWQNKVAPRALLAMARYEPAHDAPRVRAPVLVCAAAEDREAPLDHVRQLAELAPRGELRIYPGTHFDFYGRDEIRDRVLADQIAALHEHLVAAR